MTVARAAAARAEMVEEVRAMALACAEQTGRPVLSPRVLAALAAVPRHRILPGF